MNTNNLPKPENLIKGRIYKIRCRNLSYGIWNGKDGFIGIRTKFDDRFLDTEYHWDYEGTVMDAIDMNIDVPSNISLRLYLDTYDLKTGRLISFDKPVEGGGRGWYFLDTNEANQDVRPTVQMNQKLFDFLDRMIKECRDLEIE